MSALKDFSERNTPPSGLIGQALDGFTQSRLKAEAIDPASQYLRREIKPLTLLSKTLKATIAALRSEPVNVTQLAKSLELLETNLTPAIETLLPDLRQELTIAQDVLSDAFGQSLREAFAAQGIMIARHSNKFELWRFELETNFAKHVAILRYGKKIVIPCLALSVEATVKAYQSAIQLLTGRNENAQQWITQFYEASEIAKHKRNNPDKRVNIVDCYVEMVLLRQNKAFAIEPSHRTIKDYSRAQFAYDFYTFTNQQHVAYQNQYVRAHIATKVQTDNPLKCLWIVENNSPYEGRFIADIEWEGA